MKAIKLNKEEESELIKILEQSNSDIKDIFLNRIKSSVSILELAQQVDNNFKIETINGFVSYDSNNFFTTGWIGQIGDRTKDEISTIGYFLAPDGHICDSSLYDRYKKV